MYVIYTGGKHKEKEKDTKQEDAGDNRRGKSNTKAGISSTCNTCHTIYI